MDAYREHWYCPVRPCNHTTAASGAVVPYRPPTSDGASAWQYLFDHLQSFHEFDQERAMVTMRELELSHDHGRIIHAAGQRFTNFTLDTFPTDDEAGRRALEQVRAWLVGDDVSLYLHGTVGSGKTGLAVSLAKELCKYNAIKFLNTRAFLAELRSSYSAGEGIDITDTIPSYTDFLILDDIGAERPTDWARDTLATIIETQHSKSTGFVVTSNYAPSALVKRLGHDDPVVGRRIVSRLIDGGAVVKLDRADQRARKQAA